MVSISFLGAACSLLLLALCAKSDFSTPANTASRGFLRDDRWRMLSAISALNSYSYAMKVYYEDKQAPIHINGDDRNLKNILSSVCNLVAFYELVAKVDPTTNSSTSLYPLLSQVIRTSCNWMKYLVTNMTMTGSVDGLSCSPTDVTPLHLYCYRTKASDLRDVTGRGPNKLNDRLVDYYGSAVGAHSWERWVNTTSLTIAQKGKIRKEIREGINHIILAILQQVLES